MATARSTAQPNPVPHSALRAPRSIRAPRFPAQTGPWFNGEPPDEWRRRVTLVDFWTYSCANCLRTLPALREWHARYGPHGLTLLGVHTPEFSFEHDPGNVARALRELAITYPVVLDNDRAIWSRFANRFWPHRYLIDQDGRIVHDHAGEGGEAATERAIRALLAAPLPPPAFLLGDAAVAVAGEDTPGAVCVPGSPELFAGYYRGRSGNPGGFQEDQRADYSDPGDYREGYIHLAGAWRVEADAARFVGPGQGYLRLVFRGTAPNVVLAPTDSAAVEVGVQITPPAIDQPVVPPPTASTAVTVDAPRLYRLPTTAGTNEATTTPPGALHLLTLVPASAGLAVYSFTFGTC